jgi:hypothetical protein
MMKEFITKAHYPADDVPYLLELHKSNYGLCDECSTLTTYVAYPCEIVKAII